MSEAYEHVFTSEEVKHSFCPHVTLETLCLVCGAEMHGEWVGEMPFLVTCPACGERYTVAYSNEGGQQQ